MEVSLCILSYAVFDARLQFLLDMEGGGGEEGDMGEVDLHVFLLYIYTYVYTYTHMHTHTYT